jgi:hypothetical protein
VEKLWSEVLHTRTRKNVHTNMYPETLYLGFMTKIILCRRQQQYKIVWSGIVGDYLVSRHVLPHLLTGNHYRDFLLLDLLKVPNQVLLAVRARM